MPNETAPSNRFYSTPLRLGTRGSALALAQAELTKAALTKALPDLQVETVIIHTSGDKNTTQPLAEIGGKALFTKELDEALLDGRIDAAVHSLKDVPADYPRELAFAAVLPREDVRDVFIARDGSIQRIEDLPAGALLGTSSPRRAIQSQLLNPHIRTAPIRGNVATRLKKIEEGQFDATLLAKAGLNRLGLSVGHLIEPKQMIPAVGQGIVAIQCRADDADARAIFQPIHDALTGYAFEAERGLLETLGGTCRSAIAAHAQIDGNSLKMSAFVARFDGSEYHLYEAQGTIDQARQLGEQMGQHFITRYGHDFYK